MHRFKTNYRISMLEESEKNMHTHHAQYSSGDLRIDYNLPFYIVAAVVVLVISRSSADE